MATIPIGLQLFAVRQDCEKDLPGTLDKVAEMGYEGVDFAGYYDYGAAELRKLLDERDLKCCGTHIGVDTLKDDQLPATVEFALTLGNRYLIVPGLPPEWRDSRDAWRRTAEFFSAVAEKVKPHGLRTGYHNHGVEFEPIDGEIPWVTLGENTTDDVILQMDNGNCAYGGGDPIAMLERFPGRSVTVHLKEYPSPNDEAIIGEGDCPWARTFDLCEGIGATEWYIVEQCSPVLTPLECVAKCLRNLRAMGK